jgi:hypothetical protein
MLKQSISEHLPPPATQPPTPPLKKSTICLNTCTHSGDGECDDGGKDSSYSDCVYGTDCKDCGVRKRSSQYLMPSDISFFGSEQSNRAPSTAQESGPPVYHAPKVAKDEKLDSGELDALSSLGFSGS